MPAALGPLTQDPSSRKLTLKVPGAGEECQRRHSSGHPCAMPNSFMTCGMTFSKAVEHLLPDQLSFSLSDSRYGNWKQQFQASQAHPARTGGSVEARSTLSSAFKLNSDFLSDHPNQQRTDLSGA